MKSLLVSSIMSHPVIALQSDHSIHFAGGLMHLKHIRHLPVLEGDCFVGLVTHRDLLQAQSQLLGRSFEPGEPDSLSTPVSHIMKTGVWTVRPDTPVLEAARIMWDHKYGCLPVVRDRHLCGIVTEADFLGLLVRSLERRRDEEDTGPHRMELDVEAELEALPLPPLPPLRR